MKTRRLIDPLALEIRPIDDHSKYQAVFGKLRALERRLAEAEARKQKAQASAQGVKPNRPPLDRAMDLAKGGRIVVAPSEIEAADDEILALREGIIEISRRLAEVRAASSCASSTARHCARQSRRSKPWRPR
jgi:hypothetical protein